MNSFLVVLVLYKQSLRDARSYQSLGRAMGNHEPKIPMLVYDNSPVAQELPASDCWEFHYAHHPENAGVGKAYNTGCTLAFEYRLRWLLLVDQDTFFPADLFHQYSKSILQFPHARVFAPILRDHRGIISPFQYGIASGRRMKRVTPGIHNLADTCAVNSGLLVEVNAFTAAGGYDERLVLDFSDMHFLGRLGTQVTDLVVVDATGQHGHSDGEQITLDAAMVRFNHYLRGSGIMGEAAQAPWMYFLRGLLRAIKLSYRYRSLQFVESLLFRGAP